MQRRALLLSLLAPSTSPRQISGVYPHLAMFNSQNECGTGAVVPWAGKLWVLTYSPHQPAGSDDKLYEIDTQLNQTIRKESIGGTPANRMIHRESNQLFIGPYAIDTSGNVRTIPYTRAFGRPTGNARHLTDPARKIYLATMEEGFYEIDVQTLNVTQLYEDANAALARKAAKDLTGPLLPGYHGKGFYSGQGRTVYSNNGEVGGGNLPPDTPSGCLAEWNGKDWHVIRRNQFTEVTGPGGITGNPNPATDPIWAIGWDHRSLILMLLDQGTWHSYRLPKSSHSYDGAHGWNTEWPRIRDIGEPTLLMTMHGMFWRFPKSFSLKNSAGIAPRSSYLRVIGDFARWQDKIVCGCDDTATNEFFNTRLVKGKIAGPGQSQSNLWFLPPSKLDSLGIPIGRGALWIHDNPQASEPSEPYLFSGFPQRCLHLTHQGNQPLTVQLEVDRRGNNQWSPLRTLTIPANGYTHTLFSPKEQATWLRLKPTTTATKATAFFQFSNPDPRPLAKPTQATPGGGILWARGDKKGTLLLATPDSLYELNATLALQPLNDPKTHAWMLANLAPPSSPLIVDQASVIYTDEQGKRWRFPKSNVGTANIRIAREVSTERDLLHIHGTFFELPSNNAGGIALARPVSTHHLPVRDFCSWRGLTVLSGPQKQTLPAGEWITSTDGKQSLWLGASDDLWSFGKVAGLGGPWASTPVQANTPSDPYLFTGYDKKTLTLSHTETKPIEVNVEIDLTGFGLWVSYQRFTVNPGKPTTHTFPTGFNAYWLRTTSNQPATLTAQLTYA
jgi:hypothetical protein